MSSTRRELDPCRRIADACCLQAFMPHDPFRPRRLTISSGHDASRSLQATTPHEVFRPRRLTISSGHDASRSLPATTPHDLFRPRRLKKSSGHDASRSLQASTPQDLFRPRHLKKSSGLDASHASRRPLRERHLQIVVDDTCRSLSGLLACIYSHLSGNAGSSPIPSTSASAPTQISSAP